IVQAWRASRRDWKKIALAAVALAAVAGGIVASQSRGVWMGLIVGFVLYAMLMGRRFFAAAMAAGAAVALLLSVAAPVSMKGRLLSVVSSQAGTVGDQWSKQTRYEI